MINIKNICRMLLAAALVCTFMGFAENASAEVKVEKRGSKTLYLPNPEAKSGQAAGYYKENGKWKADYKWGADGFVYDVELIEKLNKEEAAYQEQVAQKEAEWRTSETGSFISNIAKGENRNPQNSRETPQNYVETAGTSLSDCQKSCQAPAKCIYSNGSYVCASSDEAAPDATPSQGIGTNTTQPASAVTGCSSNYGLFAGLIETGRKIFSGLRDLIYVVAGFGIIGVAVGGFFGNLNWKWLGAIIIALVVIATTGEIINMITGCDDFSQKMITDTLK